MKKINKKQYEAPEERRNIDRNAQFRLSRMVSKQFHQREENNAHMIYM